MNRSYNAIQILELRLSVEVEMGGMAAERRTEEQMEEITKCMISMEEKGKNGEDSISEDFAFHKAIANASGNPYFVRLIEYIGSGVIPAREMITQYSNSFNNEKLLSVIQGEHRQIWRAIKNHDKSSAREAIKEHLGNSINRHIQIKEQHSAAS
ncbi:FCD domain-containing protein [Paraglaciecola aquimarina]|uniref:FCD domain-containing protein n=1 Tax=Paraglaciecola aquimarina TaxID=1235557 RepID=A0ABU3SRM6_9ALTE|nr:FCD domain-containing protein [Paraglaciecola aquimarina]MDU0352635.1 FCD domain-containing protein [Paraglaciecola aquimarina]